MLFPDKIKYLKISAAILFTTLATIYLTFAILSLFMLYMLSFPSRSSNETALDRKIGYLMFGILLLVSLVCSISSMMSLYKENINWIFTFPTYLFLPISIPYFLVKMKLKNNRQVYEIYNNSFSQFLLFITSIVNYLLAIFPLIMGIVLIITAKLEPLTLYFGIPISLIAISMIVGTTANIINHLNGSETANKISYVGFTFVWIYKIYKTSLLRNNLHEINFRKNAF